MKHKVPVIFFVFIFNLTSIGFCQKIKKYIDQGDREKVSMWIKDHKSEEEYFEITSGEGQTLMADPMSYSAIKGEFTLVKLFIKNKDLFPDYDKWLNRTLGATTTLGDIEKVAFIVEAGADINTGCEYCLGASPISVAIRNHNIEIYNYLKEKGASLETMGAYGPLHAAAVSGEIDILKSLIENNDLNIDEQALSGDTPLTYACANGSEDIVSYLIEIGANIWATDTGDLNCINVALASGFDEIVKEHFLASEESNSNATNKFSKEAMSNEKYPYIHSSVASSDVRIYYEVIAWGADVSALNSKNETALFEYPWTSDWNDDYLEILQNLIHVQNLSLDHKNKAGLTVIEVAQKSNDKGWLKILNWAKKGAE